ncbi:NAD(P)-dependent dehydrogenase (short-subunit alcohol dehydrogenase family) [Erythromicrobium ramosum]|uniref:NAD(P)-dependent dehydrogenase (Short-subunit alcohol dehydrogenase family) n=1 Tax=Erythrobacter ramosus TaxID=35811 RepID=A0A6I4UJG8_9SPHN|nr:SDR family NAD(P)-dependent oxidoreductase [Erythrobacter ramosus]MBB3775888.1 NAD(P)-dependent dehydrogenase (short-subunit alcohol dehydrogenase family) [Erythrobacter ramosus]MXP39022.1 SDR family NAD(P)-dependent oxidoreductase [Erythrobacter ramosus]
MTDIAKPLSGRIALVTGASRGIGAATAKALARAGAHVILVSRKVKALEAVEDEIHAFGGTSTIAPIDLMEPDAVTRLASAIAGRWQTLDIMVLAAAYLPELTPTSQIEPKQFNQALLTNVVATQALLAGFDPLLRRAEAGRIIGLTSSLARTPRPYWGAYGATKAAFENLLETYAAEVERLSPLRVVIVDPGATRTEMRARAYPGEDPATVKAPEVVADRLLALLVEGFDSLHRERID